MKKFVLQIWNRDINHLFTTAKIIPVQPFSTNFVHSITTKGDENENRLICLLCSDGKIRGVLHSTNSPSIPSSLIFSIVVESQNIFPQDQNTPPDSYFFASAIKLSENYIVITINNGNIFLVSARQKTLFDSNTESNKKDLFEFVFTSFSLPINQKNNDDNQGSLINFSPCIIKYTNDSFIAINHEMTAALCKPDGTIQIIWDGSQLQTNKLPIKPSNDIDTNSTNTKNSRKQYFPSCSSFCCASVYENYLFAIHFSHDETWKGLTYGIVKEKITPLQTFDESLKSIIAMEPYESGIFCLCDTNSGNNRDKNDDENSRFSVISIDIDKNQIIKSSILNFKELNQNNNFVIDFKVIDNKKTLLCMTENSIITYTSDIENHISQDSVNIAGNLIKFSICF